MWLLLAAPGAGTRLSLTPAHRRVHSIGLVCLGLCSCLASPLVGDETCFECHAAPGLAERIADGGRTTAAREELEYKGQGHVDLGCADCHPQAGRVPHPAKMTVVGCESCHEAVLPHVVDPDRAADSGDKVPTCIGCHGYHGVLAVSSAGRRGLLGAVPHLCIDCHRDLGGDPHPLTYLTRSVHARTQESGGPAAVCTECHLAHPLGEEGARLTGVTRPEVPATCGVCHEDILREYEGSIHGEALKQGNPDVPICTTCHSEHKILATDDPESSIHPLRLPETCGQCHGELPLMTGYDVDPEVYETYRDSYHGTANRYGSLAVADCGSCHGFHDILPSSDPRSSVHPANLVGTCGECHEGISEKVARGQVHVRISRARAPALFWVAFGFKWLTILTMAALIGHMTLDFAKKMKLRWEAASRPERREGRDG